MSEQATTTEAPAAPTTTEAAPAPESAPAASSDFSMDSWKEAGGSRSELPDNFRQFYDHINDQHKKQDAFNAVRELRSMIDGADKKAGAGSQRPAEAGSDVEKQVQARLAQLQNSESVSKFRNNFETMLKEPISVGDGHSFAFADKGELEKFVNYSRDVLQNGKITPMDLYKLYNFERILADTGEWKARQHEESLRKASGSSRAEAATQNATETSNKNTSGERDSNLTVEEIMQQKFPEIYGNMKAGNVRYG